MQLKQFRIHNFRSVEDSGWINASDLTALLGRNESGKSNLLRALHSMKPPEGLEALSKIKDFPRHRRLEECTDDTLAVSTVWELTDDDRARLKQIWSRGAGAKTVTIRRFYGERRTVAFANVKSLDFDAKNINSKAKKIAAAAKAKAAKLEGDTTTNLEAAADGFLENAEAGEDSKIWAKSATNALSQLRQELASADVELTETQEGHVNDLEELAREIVNDEEASQQARNWAVTQMPVFIYLDEYPSLKGEQNIAEYLQRKTQNKLTDADVNFEKMCKVAGLDPQELQNLLGQSEQETRNQLANRASSVITQEIRRLWKDRPLKVRFDTDAGYIHTYISDPSAVYDVEVNLDERSRGFQWFFSFYISFAADTDGGEAEDAILLLDEPGLYLHAKSQRDLLKHLKDDFPNQIIYTTHSPFMVPTTDLDSIRTVNISQDEGTTVRNDPTGDDRTLFPLQAALGYDLAQSLFVGPNNLVVEGVTDYWVLSAISEYLNSNGQDGLRSDITITPAGGAQKIPYMVALLGSEQLNVLALLDLEKAARSTRDELVKSKLIVEKNVLFVSDAFAESSAPKEADIEDLMDAKVYERLVRESYARELKGVTIELNDKLPRIVQRFEEAFDNAGLKFHKSRPLRLFLSKIANEPDKVLNGSTIELFKALFSKINSLI